MTPRPQAIALLASLCLGAPAASAAPSTDDWGRTHTTKDCADNCRTFMVNFVILAPVSVPNPEAKMQAEVDILNKHFRTKEGYQLFNFVKKKVTTYHQVQQLKGCPKLKALGHLRHELDSGFHEGERTAAIEQCASSKDSDASTLFDPHAINFYIFDNYESAGSSGGAHQAPNKRWPFVLVDYKRLGHRLAVEEHEMGHALGGLDHVCVVGVGKDDPSPIMSTPNRWPGATTGCRAFGGLLGDRSVGFSDHTLSYRVSAPIQEISRIVAEANKVQNALGPSGSPAPGSPAQW